MWGTTLVAITSRADDGLFDSLAGLRQAGFAVALVLVQPTGLPATAQNRAALLRLPWREVWHERDLEQWR
jgi:hypothetical protein